MPTAVIVEADLREQRAAVKFCFLLGKTGTETLEMLKTAYKGDALGKTQVFEWFSRYKSSEMSIDDQARSGCPSTARTDENVEKNSQNYPGRSTANHRRSSGEIWYDMEFSSENFK
ncbi:Hypothetical protein CINCED_3A016760 [Cinara cedri]|uniref:Mos1 transposase HTH domain-containing protein n=1 Tax=Cinara cedri TaxID=506608 RepID=A0A5E4M1G3_9HEMI|nr:Hypothetical protein CINCED_3A016760 [Cinara cedri]